MTEADSGGASPANAARPAKRQETPARESRRPHDEAAAPAGTGQASRTKASPAQPSRRTNLIVMAKHAESLAALSANLTQAMTRANQVFSTAFIDQAKDGATWQPDPLGVQGALNEVWSHLAQQPETLREAHAKLWQRYADIWQRHATYMLTGKAPEKDPRATSASRIPSGAPTRRFSMLRESYLATSRFITDLVKRPKASTKPPSAKPRSSSSRLSTPHRRRTS